MCADSADDPVPDIWQTCDSNPVNKTSTLEVGIVCSSTQQGDGDGGEELPLFSLVSLNPGTAPTVEVPWSQLLALSLSPTDAPPVLTVGRGEDCNVRLGDQRVSLRHFEVVVRKRQPNGPAPEGPECGSYTYDCFLNDSSSNGTAVNGRLLGKGKSCKLRSGDAIAVLLASVVGPEKNIEFIFRNYTADLVTPKATMEREPKLADHLKCPICMCIIHQCVAVMPCVHNFCSACFSDWMFRAGNCPVCRTRIKAIIKNHAVDDVIEAFLASHPEDRRPEAELEEYDQRDKLKLGRGGKMVHSLDGGMGPEASQACSLQ
mmetsp:Transcript_93393/g.264393  ORF Transcript_93393/g.264393 Transcript_93393/m.264393 type:complete len:317 (+) Transcript_93393:77-1027(+)